jgi:hypothetical protein
MHDDRAPARTRGVAFQAAIPTTDVIYNVTHGLDIHAFILQNDARQPSAHTEVWVRSRATDL